MLAAVSAMNRLHLRIGAAALGAATVLLTHQQLSAPVIAASHTYRYVIKKPRLSGIADADIERKALQRMLQSPQVEGVEIEVGDECDRRDCDLITIVETDDKSFKVNFYPKAAALNNKDHNEMETRRQPYPNETLIWKQGSREIAKMFTNHLSVHLSLPQKSTP
jgi:hypothetical protein